MAGNFIGRLQSMGIAKEDVRGTAEAAADYWLPIKSFNHEDKRNYVFNDSPLGTIVDVQGEEIVQEWAEGGFEAFIGDKHFGFILLALLGTCASAAGTGGDTAVYTHTFTLQEDCNHDCLSILTENPNEELGFALAMINSLTINFEKGKILDYEVNFTSKKGIAQSNTVAYAAENLFRPQDFSFKLASAVAGLTAASATPVESFSITFEKNIEPIFPLGSASPTDILNKAFSITGEFTQLYSANTQEALALAGTSQAMRIAITNSSVTLGATKAPAFSIDLQPCALTEVAFDRGLNDLVKTTIAFKAMYSLSLSKIIDNCTLVNLATAYT